MYKVGDRFIARPKTDMHKVPPGSKMTIVKFDGGLYSVKWDHLPEISNAIYTTDDIPLYYTQVKKKLIILIED